MNLHRDFKALAMGAILFATAGSPALAQEEDEDSRTGIDLVTLLKAGRQARGVPIPALAWERRSDDRYALLAEINRLIARRPDEPELHEIRARVWLDLGWPRRAGLDISRARQLRRTAEPGLN